MKCLKLENAETKEINASQGPGRREWGVTAKRFKGGREMKNVWN